MSTRKSSTSSPRGPRLRSSQNINHPKRLRDHVADLVRREKTTGLSPGDKSELDHYVHIEHLMRLAKAPRSSARDPMSRTHIPAMLRRFVRYRAHNTCEYCLIHEDDTFFGCEVDHIISEKHGGLTVAENLAFACLVCNRNKGSDLGSLAEGTGLLVRFFNPRVDDWPEHFHLDDVVIRPLTIIGEATERVLKLNDIERLIERSSLRAVGRYPVGIVPENP